MCIYKNTKHNKCYEVTYQFFNRLEACFTERNFMPETATLVKNHQ